MKTRNIYIRIGLFLNNLFTKQITNIIFRNIIFCIVFTIISIHSEGQYILKGCVTDSTTDSKISFANIKVKGSINGCSCNIYGEFELKVDSLPISISVSHIGFEVNEIYVKSAISKLNIKLKSMDIILPVTEISAKRPLNITKNTKLYVIDYDFVGDSILLLAYKNQKFSQSNLMILSSKGDTLKSKNLNDLDFLFKDCFDNEHLISKTTANQIFINKESIELIYPTNRDSFINLFNTIVENHEDFFYIKQNTSNNQIVNFYIYNKRNDSMNLMKSIVDEGGLERLGDKGRLQSMDGYTEFDARFEEMCFYAPKIISLVKTKNGLILFNFVENEMDFFDFDGSEIASKPISFHTKKDWGKSILTDEKTGKVYTTFEKNGIYTLYEVDLVDGSIKGGTKIPEFAFVQNIKVNNGQVYFLYNDVYEFDYKQLFCLKL